MVSGLGVLVSKRQDFSNDGVRWQIFLQLNMILIIIN
jgi:hypothetical protein